MTAAALLTSLWMSFLNPPDSARPWCYWWWINGHADRETITSDLEAMKRLGFGGVLMFDSRGYFDDEDHVVNPKAEIVWGSPAWHDLVEFSVRECARLGLEFTMNASASGGTLNGFIDGREYETDIMSRDEVVAHLDRAIGPILKRVPNLVGKTFTHIYSPSYEGNVMTGGSWKTIKDTFYATMSEWAHGHDLKLYSESGGPWYGGGASAKLDCSQLDILALNDFPQGEFWPLRSRDEIFDAGHANRNGHFFQRGIVLSARREGRRIVSMEAFTHMMQHYSVDPAFLKPLADVAFADGANRMVWHAFTSSPKKFGVPGAEYFAGTHINRNVTWHNEAGAFVKYLWRCQAMLQRGEYVDDGEFVDVKTNYYGWGRYRNEESALFTKNRKDEPTIFTKIHRREGNVDWFFVAGEGKDIVMFNASTEGRMAEIWDPVAITRKVARGQPLKDGKSFIWLDLPVGGSCFVVFAPREAGENGRVERVERVDVSITNAWQVSFAYHDGISAAPPAPLVMETLRDWISYGADGDASSASLRYFSGTATYRTTFSYFHNFTFLQNSTFSLSLGFIPTGLAHVFVNGVDCGVAWCAPWEVDVSSAIREGENEIEILYTNNWNNRLVGDCFLSEGERITRSTLRYWSRSATWFGEPIGEDVDGRRYRRARSSGPSADDPLQPSGILGPVSIKFSDKNRKETK